MDVVDSGAQKATRATSPSPASAWANGDRHGLGRVLCFRPLGPVGGQDQGDG